MRKLSNLPPIPEGLNSAERITALIFIGVIRSIEVVTVDSEIEREKASFLAQQAFTDLKNALTEAGI